MQLLCNASNANAKAMMKGCAFLAGQAALRARTRPPVLPTHPAMLLTREREREFTLSHPAQINHYLRVRHHNEGQGHKNVGRGRMRGECLALLFIALACWRVQPRTHNPVGESPTEANRLKASKPGRRRYAKARRRSPPTRPRKEVGQAPGCSGKRT